MWPNIPQLKMGNMPVIFSNFQNCLCCEKHLKNNKHIWFKNMLRYLFLEIMCSSKLAVFHKLCSRENDCFLELMMSVDENLSIFSYQVEAIVYIIIIVIFEWYVKIVVKYHLNITTIHLYNELKLFLNILKPV